MGFGQTSLSGVRRGFMPPQLKTKHPKNGNHIFQSLNHVDVNLKPRVLIKRGYYIEPSPSTALACIIWEENRVLLRTI